MKLVLKMVEIIFWGSWDYNADPQTYFFQGVNGTDEKAQIIVQLIENIDNWEPATPKDEFPTIQHLKMYAWIRAKTALCKFVDK